MGEAPPSKSPSSLKFYLIRTFHDGTVFPFASMKMLAYWGRFSGVQPLLCSMALIISFLNVNSPRASGCNCTNMKMAHISLETGSAYNEPWQLEIWTKYVENVNSKHTSNSYICSQLVQALQISKEYLATYWNRALQIGSICQFSTLLISLLCQNQHYDDCLINVVTMIIMSYNNTLCTYICSTLQFQSMKYKCPIKR